jgi:hypothetical protein
MQRITAIVVEYWCCVFLLFAVHCSTSRLFVGGQNAQHAEGPPIIGDNIVLLFPKQRMFNVFMPPTLYWGYINISIKYRHGRRFGGIWGVWVRAGF